jgi:hypothetical protein
MTKPNKPQSDNNKTTNKKPVSLYPLNFKEAVAALLKVKPKPKEEKTEVKKEEKPNLIVGLFFLCIFLMTGTNFMSWIKPQEFRDVSISYANNSRLSINMKREKRINVIVSSYILQSFYGIR